MNKLTKTLLIGTAALAGLSADFRPGAFGPGTPHPPVAATLHPMNCGACTPGASDWRFAGRGTAVAPVLQLSGAEIRGLSQLGLVGF